MLQLTLSLQVIVNMYYVGDLSMIFFHFFMNILYRKRNLTNYQIILSVTTLITFWPFSPAGNVFNNWLLIVYSLPLSFYFNEFFGYKKFNKS